MSTRCFIGVGHAEGYRARYCHWDGYPEGVGKTVWLHMREYGAVMMMNAILEKEWSEIAYMPGPDDYVPAMPERDGEAYPFWQTLGDTNTDIEYGYLLGEDRRFRIYANGNAGGDQFVPVLCGEIALDASEFATADQMTRFWKAAQSVADQL